MWGQGHRPVDALADWEHSFGYAAASGKKWCEFTLMITCRPHPDQIFRHLDCGVTARRDGHLILKRNTMELLKIYNEIVEMAEVFVEELVKAPKNKSANRRARRKSVAIRNKYKELRKLLLEMEKNS